MDKCTVRHGAEISLLTPVAALTATKPDMSLLHTAARPLKVWLHPAQLQVAGRVVYMPWSFDVHLNRQTHVDSQTLMHTCSVFCGFVAG